MPSGADSSPRLAEAQICEINGMSQTLRQSWVDRGLLRKAPSQGCELADALDLAALRAFSHVLGPNDGAICWRELRPALARTDARDQLDAIYDTQYKKAALATTKAELRDLVAHGRPVRVIALAALRREIRGAYQRLAREVAKSPSKRSKGIGKSKPAH